MICSRRSLLLISSLMIGGALNAALVADAPPVVSNQRATNAEDHFPLAWRRMMNHLRLRLDPSGSGPTLEMFGFDDEPEANLTTQPLAISPDLTVDTSGGNSPYPVTADTTYNNVYVGNTSTGVLNQSAGTLTANTSLYVGNAAASSGTYNLTGGALAVSGTSYIGYSGTGSFVQSGTSSVTSSTGNTAGSISLGYNTGSVGTYSLADSAQLTVASALNIGVSSAGANVFTQTGGTVSVGNNGAATSTDGVDIGVNPGSSGTFNLSGGTFSAFKSGQFIVGNYGTGVVNQTGGTLMAPYVDLLLGYNAYGSAGGSGTYNLSGGSASFLEAALGSSFTTNSYGAVVQSGASTLTINQSILLGQGINSVASYSLADSANLTALTLIVGFYNSASTFTQTGGTAKYTTQIDLGGGGTVSYPSTSTKGVYNLSGGSLSTPTLYDAFTGAGVFTQSGNSTAAITTLYLGYNGNSGSRGGSAANFGTYSLADTATLTGTSLYVGAYSPGANAFTQTGGTANFSSAVYLGYSTNSTNGTLNLSGGSFTCGGSLYVGYQGTGTVNQTGGTLTVGGSGVSMGPVGNYSSGVYNLGGTGILATPAVNGALGSTFNFNGGTLQATADSSAFLVGTANVQAGGAVIDSNGHNITVAQPLAHDNSAVGNSLDGGLKKIGLGTLTLTNQSTITGPTVINAGTLALSDGLGAALGKTASLTINAGGTVTLGFSSQINTTAPTTLNANSGPGAGATVAFNTGGYSQSLGALTLSSTSVVSFGGTAGILHFANSGAQPWTGTLAVWNWVGTAVSGGGADELIFGSNTASLTNAQLAEIQFYSDNGTTLLAAAGFASSGTGEVVPGGPLLSTVPEPATWLGAAFLICVTARRYAARFPRRSRVCAGNL